MGRALNQRRGRREERKEETPLFSHKSERIVLGTALRDPAFFHETAERLKPEHFATGRFGRIWQAMGAAAKAGRKPNATWVPMFIQNDAGEDDPLVPLLALVQNDAMEEGVGHSDIHVDTIIQLAHKRVLLQAIDDARYQVLTADFGTEPALMQDVAMQAIAKSVGASSNHIRTYGEWGAAAFDEIAEAVNKRETDDSAGVGLLPGLRGVEDVLGRLMPGKVYGLAGMSGSGKSALIGQIMEAACDDAKAKGLGWGYVASLEMTGKEYAIRSISRKMGFPSERIEVADIDYAQTETVGKLAARLHEYNIEVDSTPNMTFDTIRSHMISLKNRRGGIAIAAIDHLLIIAAEKGQDMFQKVTDATMKIKNLAKDLGIPIILLMQVLEKKVMESGRKWPHTGHLFGGETITQNADVIAFVHNHNLVLDKLEPAKGKEGDENNKAHNKWLNQKEKEAGIAHIYNDKRRGGKRRVERDLRFDGPTMRFDDI